MEGGSCASKKASSGERANRKVTLTQLKLDALLATEKATQHAVSILWLSVRLSGYVVSDSL